MGNTNVDSAEPTHDELVQRVKYWAKVVLNIRYWWFCTRWECIGCAEIREKNFALDRIDDIASILGDSEAGSAFDEA